MNDSLSKPDPSELVELGTREAAEISGGDGAHHFEVPICLFPVDPAMPQIPPVL